MKRDNLFYRILSFYVEGFRSMTVGRTLWALILLKLFIMFAILKVFFFPDYLGRFKTDEQKGDFVKEQFINLKPD